MFYSKMENFKRDDFLFELGLHKQGFSLPLVEPIVIPGFGIIASNSGSAFVGPLRLGKFLFSNWGNKIIDISVNRDSQDSTIFSTVVPPKSIEMFTSFFHIVVQDKERIVFESLSEFDVFVKTIELETIEIVA